MDTRQIQSQARKWFHMFIDTLDIDPKRVGRVVEVDEIRKAQIEMLDVLADYCDRNGITYYLSAG